MTTAALPRSILDTDLYKLTMQQAVLQTFPDIKASYQFTNRDKNMQFSRQSIDEFRSIVSHFTDIYLTNIEYEWLKRTCPFLREDYLNYLSAYRFKPEQVQITFAPLSADGNFGDVQIQVTGPWVETILWEVPLMACLSECFFQSVATDWNYDNQAESAYAKGKALIEAGCFFSEFGTRRRRSYHTQDLLVKELIRASNDISGPGGLSGTSNAHFAEKYAIPVIGTVAHEWFMGVAALKGYENATSTALDLWESVYPHNASIALTDTFSTEAFFKDFVTDVERVRRWKGLRQDSGDPFAFGPRAKQMYQSLDIDHRDKMVIYSDSLDVKKAIDLQKQCNETGIKASFGIGTFLTNDFYTLSSGGAERSKPLNMVIKLSSVDGRHCVKISDDLTKNTGDPATVEGVKRTFGLPI